MNDLVNTTNNEVVTSDRIQNIILSCITMSLNEISVTLALMYDLMEEEKE